MSDQPVARPLPTQDNITQKDADKHPCLERDSNPRSQQPTGQDRRLRLHGHCDWHRSFRLPKHILGLLYNNNNNNNNNYYYYNSVKLN
jgi:hypothetical protein